MTQGGGGDGCRGEGCTSLISGEDRSSTAGGRGERGLGGDSGGGRRRGLGLEIKASCGGGAIVTIRSHGCGEGGSCRAGEVGP